MEGVKNRLDVKELNSGKVYTFYYRTPEIDEWVEHTAKIRKALKLDEEASLKEIAAIKIEAAELIITAIAPDQFEVEVDGKEIFLSPSIEDWKGILKRRFYYLLFVVFDDAFAKRGVAEVEKKS